MNNLRNRIMFKMYVFKHSIIFILVNLLFFFTFLYNYDDVNNQWIINIEK